MWNFCKIFVFIQLMANKAVKQEKKSSTKQTQQKVTNSISLYLIESYM